MRPAGRRSGGSDIRSLGDPALCFEANDNTRPEGGQVDDPDQEGTVDDGPDSKIDSVTGCQDGDPSGHHQGLAKDEAPGCADSHRRDRTPRAQPAPCPAPWARQVGRAKLARDRDLIMQLCEFRNACSSSMSGRILSITVPISERQLKQLEKLAGIGRLVSQGMLRGVFGAFHAGFTAPTTKGPRRRHAG